MGTSINCCLSLLLCLLHQWHLSLPLPVAAPDDRMQVDTGPCSVSPSSFSKPVDTLPPLRTSHLCSNSGGTHPTRGTISPTSSCHSQEKVDVSSAWLTHHIVLHRHMDTLLYFFIYVYRPSLSISKQCISLLSFAQVIVVLIYLSTHSINNSSNHVNSSLSSTSCFLLISNNASGKSCYRSYPMDSRTSQWIHVSCGYSGLYRPQ